MLYLQRVMPDSVLLVLYDAQTKVLAQVVKQNFADFSTDLMFHLSSDEFKILRSPAVASNNTYGVRCIAPFELTEQGSPIKVNSRTCFAQTFNFLGN